MITPIIALLAAGTLSARAFETSATHAWVYDITTKTVLLDKGGSESVPPASMSKLMTIEMLFDALQDGRVQMDTTFGVSAKAVSYTEQGGSTMYLQQGDRPTVQELILGMIVNSGNDACTVVAEGLEGSEEEFARKMTERAKTLGLESSTFANSSGWPDPGQRMSMKDLGLLSVHIIETYPELYKTFAETEYNYKDRAPANANNRNPLLKLGIGADGLKTGHTQEAGYGMVGSVKQGERRIIFSFNGVASDLDRAQEAERIANWAFRQFALKTVVKAGTQIADADVFLGNAAKVGLVADQDLRLLIPAGATNAVSADVLYQTPLKAPIKKGDKLGQLVIYLPELPESRVDLFAASDIGEAGFMDRVMMAFTTLRSRYGV
ncbi:MAG: D-alanyl-D-alanine carboxypeptidase [Candidatus Saccharibacteria bacterium]|nr:D-alanyl-D-alanine carboxypeptidase [Pseudorhodobacter sp.]